MKFRKIALSGAAAMVVATGLTTAFPAEEAAVETASEATAETAGETITEVSGTSEGTAAENEIYTEILFSLEDKTLGYAFMDLNNDEIDELLIGPMSGQGEDTEILEIYAVVNDKAEQVFTAKEQNTYTLSEVDGAITICMIPKDESSTSETVYYDLLPGKKSLSIRSGFVYDTEEDTENPYFMDYGLCQLQPTNEETWNERKSAFSDAIVIAYESLSAFAGGEEALEAGETEVDTTEITFTQIDQETAKQMMAEDDGHIVIDVRRQDEYDTGHIPGAVLLPNETIETTQPEELPDKEQIILVYCRSGNRSKQAAGKLAAMGYTNVFEFGGINDWTGETEIN